MTPTPDTAAALPTPHDITAIPYVAWSPGLGTWIGAALLVVFVALLRRWLASDPAPAASISPHLLVRAELDRLASERSNRPLTEFEVERLSLLIRRFLSASEDRPLEHLTSRELALAAEASGSENLRAVLERVALLEELKFRPAGAASLEAGELEKLAAVLASYDAARPPRDGGNA